MVVGDVADQHDPFYPRCPPSQHEGGAADQKQGLKGDPLPGRRKIEEDRLHPRRIFGIEILPSHFARQPGRIAAPEIEKEWARHAVVEEKR